MLRNFNLLGALLCCVVCLAASGCERTHVGELAGSLSDKDHNVRYDAVKKLEDYGPEAITAVEDLAAALADPNPKIRYRSAKALSKVGQGAAPVASQVQAALKDAEPEMRYYLVKTLANIEDAAVIALVELDHILTSDPDPRCRQYAAKALGEIGKPAAPVTKSLEAALKDRDANVRKTASESLKKVAA